MAERAFRGHLPGPLRSRRPPAPRRALRPSGARRSALCVAALGVASQLPAIATAGVGRSPRSALVAARALVPPKPTAQKGGELEGYEFWEEHDELLAAAWRELGSRHEALYRYDDVYDRFYIADELRAAADAARGGHGDAHIRRLFSEIVPGVFASSQLFTDAFLSDMLAELSHIENSGIPRRRPNGMNRYGVILDQVGMEAALNGLVDAYIRPLAATLFPELVGRRDASEHYAFTVRYEEGGDTELAKHGDAAVVTLNLCLGRPGWQGGALRFFESGGEGLYRLPKGNESAGAGDVRFHTGMTIMHRGQHKHQALPLEGGERTNLVLWLMGDHGVVRVAPYPLSEQLAPSQRWQPLGESGGDSADESDL